MGITWIYFSTDRNYVETVYLVQMDKNAIIREVKRLELQIAILPENKESYIYVN